jgi:hypothetical protein
MSFGPINNNRLNSETSLSPLNSAKVAPNNFTSAVAGFFSEPVKEQRSRAEIETWHQNLAPGAKPGSPQALTVLSRYLGSASRSFDQSA